MTMRQPDPLAELFPPFGLQIAAGPLSMRVFRDADFDEYAQLLNEPIFATLDAPEVFSWCREEPAERVRSGIRFQWETRVGMRPANWSLNFGVWHYDSLIGAQDVRATDFATCRTISSGSWLTLAMHGKGLGKLMRQAMLVFAFDHLGALRAESGAVIGNDASAGVSRACGYLDNGVGVDAETGWQHPIQRFLLTPADFRRPAETVTVTGLTAELLAMLGADHARDDDDAPAQQDVHQLPPRPAIEPGPKHDA